jgi:lipoate-protein ligase A
VLNISQCLPGISKSEFHIRLYNYVRSFFNAGDHVADIQIQDRINSLAREKYSTWEWIYGWSPDYRFTNKWTNGKLTIDISLDVHRGIITACCISGETFRADLMNKLLTGERHCHASISQVLKQSGVDSIAGKDFEDLVYAFF